MAGGFLKSMRGASEMLYCDNGIWKTGYEDLNLDVSGVCVSQGMFFFFFVSVCFWITLEIFE